MPRIRTGIGLGVGRWRVLNANPSDITLSANTIAENNAEGAVVGAFSTTDPDNGNTYTYTKAEGTGDTNNGSFDIDGANLIALESFNFEDGSSRSIRVRSTDQGGLYFEKVFTITIINSQADDAPTLLGATVVSDVQIDLAWTINAVGQDGHRIYISTDNATFTEKGTVLGATATYSATGLTAETLYYFFVVAYIGDIESAASNIVSDTTEEANQSPTDISLSANSIAENNEVGDIIGVFSITDPNVGDTFTYTLVAGDGDTDNASFTIDGANLKAGIAFDYETKNSYSIRVRSTDQGDLYFEKQFTISITDADEVDLDYVSATNATSALTIPTYDTSNQLVHPSVYYNADGWSGHKYWMVMTPFPSGNSDYENPSIVVSEDGITWAVPDGLTNPIEAKPDGGFNADPNLVLGDDNKLYVFFCTIISGVVTMYYKSSSDGITWGATTPASLTTADNIGSPSIFKDGDHYVLYYIIGSVNPNVFKRCTCATLIGTWSAPTTCNLTGVPVGKEIWHGEVKKWGGEYHSVIVICTANTSGNSSLLHFATSPNGIDWTVKTDPLLSLSASWDNSLIYKGTIVSFGVYHKLWYSALSVGGVWKVGLTSIYLTDKPPTDIALDVSDIDENNSVGDVIGTLSSTDADAGDTFTYSLVSGTGSTDNASFSIDGANLKAGAIFDYEAKSSYAIRVRSTDQDGLYFEKQFTITINDVFEIPTLNDNLISVWEMEETSGSTAFDSKADNDLTITGATVNQAGKTGKAFSYDGAGDYLSAAGNIITGFPYSLSFWIKVGASGINRVIANDHASKYYGVHVGCDYNQLVVQFGDGVGLATANRKTYTLANATTPGNWYHVVVVATAHGEFTFYLNTVVKTLTYNSGGAASTSFAAGTFRVGNTSWSPVGTIDQVAVWNRALSSDDVALLYNSGNGLAYTSW